VGAQLAPLEMKVIIREVLNRVDLTVPDPAPEKPRMRHVTLVPARGTKVVAQSRIPEAPIGPGKRRTVTLREHIAVTPREAWGAVADVTRIGEWSPECTGGSWLGNLAEPVVGARFAGTNRKDKVRWTTRCTITQAEPGRALTWDVKLGLPLARWSFVFTPTEHGTLVEQTGRDLRVGPLGSFSARLGEAALRTGARADHNERTMRATLAALKQHLESAHPVTKEPATP
jgi:polyketide cyclase/dehydrase/lipid transport protein